MGSCRRRSLSWKSISPASAGSSRCRCSRPERRSRRLSGPPCARSPTAPPCPMASSRAGSGGPRRARAVGAANGANPLPIVVPCHRVIGADRSLTGFGGGLETKRFLLALEAGIAPPLANQPDLFARASAAALNPDSRASGRRRSPRANSRARACRRAGAAASSPAPPRPDGLPRPRLRWSSSALASAARISRSLAWNSVVPAYLTALTENSSAPVGTASTRPVIATGSSMRASAPIGTLRQKPISRRSSGTIAPNSSASPTMWPVLTIG